MKALLKRYLQEFLGLYRWDELAVLAAMVLMALVATVVIIGALVAQFG